MKVIAIATPKGGTGKSTIALTLAAILSNKRRILVVDADEQGSIAKWQEISKQDVPDVYVQPKPIIDEILSHIDYDIVIIDTPPSYREQMESVLKATEKIIIPVTPGFTDVWSTQAFLAKHKSSDIRLLISKVDRRTKLGRMFRPLLEQLKVPLFKTEIPNRITIAEAWAAGQTINFYQPDSDGAKDFHKLAKEVLHWLKE